MPADKVAGDSIAKRRGRRVFNVQKRDCSRARTCRSVRRESTKSCIPCSYRAEIQSGKKKFPRGVYTRGYLANSTLDDSSVSSQQEEGEDEEEEEEEDVC